MPRNGKLWNDMCAWILVTNKVCHSWDTMISINYEKWTKWSPKQVGWSILELVGGTIRYNDPHLIKSSRSGWLYVLSSFPPHWFRWRLVACSVSGHFLNQWRTRDNLPLWNSEGMPHDSAVRARYMVPLYGSIVWSKCHFSLCFIVLYLTAIHWASVVLLHSRTKETVRY